MTDGEEDISGNVQFRWFIYLSYPALPTLPPIVTVSNKISNQFSMACYSPVIIYYKYSRPVHQTLRLVFSDCDFLNSALISSSSPSTINTSTATPARLLATISAFSKAGLLPAAISKPSV